MAAALDGLDVLVNNAGQNLPGGRSEYDPEVFEEVVAVNLFAAFRMAIGVQGRCSSASAIDGGASVVNVGSMSSFFGIEIVPGYGAAKAARGPADQDAGGGLGAPRHPGECGRPRASSRPT